MECKRILLGKPFVLLLVALLLVNTYFFVYQNRDEETDFFYYRDTYDAVLTQLSDLSFEEALAWCEEFEEEANQQWIEGTWDFSQESAIKRMIVQQVGEQYAHLIGYGEYLENIQKNAKMLQGVSLFADNSSFAYKNTVKTAEDFASLSGVSVTAGHDLAVTGVFADAWTEIISLIPIFLVCGLFLQERRKGLHVLVNATPMGRGKLAVKRIGILFLASAITVLVLFGSKIFLNGYLYRGLGEWGRTLQSIPMFYNVPYSMTVGKFWLWYLAVKIVGLFFAGLVLWLIQALISNISAAVGVLGVVAGVEFAFTAIPSSSFFAPLRYVNLFSYINYQPVFTRYLNLSVFGSPVSGNAIACILLPILCCILAFLLVLVSKKKYPIGGKRRSFQKWERFKAKADRAFSGGGLFVKEAKKLLFYRRGILVLLILILLLAQFGVPYRDEMSSDMYRAYYQEKYAGPITEDTVKALQEELTTATESEQISALTQMLSEISRAKDGDWIVPSEPYEALFTVQQYHYTVALTALLFLSLLVSPIASQERQAETVTLLYSTSGGRRRLWLMKQALIFSATLVVWFLVYGSELFRLTDFYGNFTCLAAPLSSLARVSLYDWNISLGQTLVLLYALRLSVLWTAAQFCFALSSVCKKNSNAVILNCSILILPAALGAIGSSIGSCLSMLLPLTVIDLAPAIFPYLFLLMIFIAAAALSRCFCKIK